MQAVILAAGLNTRFLNVFDKNFTKQALMIGETPILVKTLVDLESIGCTEIVLVVGRNKELIEKLIDEYYKGTLSITYVENHKPDRANGYSFGLAQNHAQEWFYLLMSDHLFDQSFMNHVKAYTGENKAALFVDYKIDQVFDLYDATKVQEKNSQILELGKKIKDYNCIDTGFFILNKDIFKTFNTIEALNHEISLSDIIIEYSKEHPFYTSDIGNAIWQDIDDPDMLDHALKTFLR